ncbi:MAG: hypothetical protein M0P15_09695 [Bacteroides sp.]|nr:hypothetical protein [Bacteroides sp.]
MITAQEARTLLENKTEFCLSKVFQEIESTIRYCIEHNRWYCLFKKRLPKDFEVAIKKQLMQQGFTVYSDCYDFYSDECECFMIISW